MQIFRAHGLVAGFLIASLALSFSSDCFACQDEGTQVSDRSLPDHNGAVTPIDEARFKEMFETVDGVYVVTAIEVGKSPEDVDLVRFRILDIPKGPPSGRDIKVQCRGNVPRLNSNWILFIETFVPKDGFFKTINGDSGRLPANEANLKHLYALPGSNFTDRSRSLLDQVRQGRTEGRHKKRER